MHKVLIESHIKEAIIENDISHFVRRSMYFIRAISAYKTVRGTVFRTDYIPEARQCWCREHGKRSTVQYGKCFRKEISENDINAMYKWNPDSMKISFIQ